MSSCAFADSNCSGKPQWHHPIKRQRIKGRFPLGAYRIPGDEDWQPMTPFDSAKVLREAGSEVRSLSVLLVDPRNRVWVCWHHHQQIEGDYSNLPASVHEFADEFGLSGMLANDMAKQGYRGEE